VPSLRNYLENTGRSASATGLTGLDQTATAFSWGAWLWLSRNLALGRPTLWGHADNQASPKNGILVFANPDGGIRLGVQTGSNNNFDSVAGIVPHRAWCHVGVMYNGSRYFTYRNGVLVSSVACSTTPTVSGTRATQIGWNVSSSTSLRSARLWDIRVFPALALSHGEMMALADPRSILRGCKQRLCYQRNWRVQGSGAVTLFDESGNGNNLTTSATTLEADTDAEPDWYGILRGRRVFGRVAGGGAAALAGDILAALTTTGALTVDKPLAGSISAVVTSTGALTVPKPLAAALDIAVTLTGGLAGSAAALAGAISAVVTATGALTVPKPLAGALSAAVTAAGALTVPKPLAGAISAAVTLTGSIGAGVSGLITATLTWLARHSAALTALARHDADLSAMPTTDATLTAVPRHDADLTHLTDD
jgi:hypothetical protein